MFSVSPFSADWIKWAIFIYLRNLEEGGHCGTSHFRWVNTFFYENTHETRLGCCAVTLTPLESNKTGSAVQKSPPPTLYPDPKWNYVLTEKTGNYFNSVFGGEKKRAQFKWDQISNFTRKNYFKNRSANTKISYFTKKVREIQIGWTYRQMFSQKIILIIIIQLFAKRDKCNKY